MLVCNSQPTSRSASPQKGAEFGFTLVELAIVIVIVGLILAGILTGRSLIAQSQVRAALTQIEQFRSATNSFHSKYGALPGDILETDAATMGLYASGSTATGLGNGDNLITDTSLAAGNLNTPVGETVMFWRHLSDAGLTSTTYGANIAAGGVLAGGGVSGNFPTINLNSNLYLIVGSSIGINGAGVNYFGLVNIFGVLISGGTASYVMSKGISPVQALQIDTKLDDGLPNMGAVQARGTASTATLDGIFPTLSATDAAQWSTATAANAVAGDCLAGGTSATDTTNGYAVASSASQNVMACNLLITGGF